MDSAWWIPCQVTRWIACSRKSWIKVGTRGSNPGPWAFLPCTLANWGGCFSCIYNNKQILYNQSKMLNFNTRKIQTGKSGSAMYCRLPPHRRFRFCNFYLQTSSVGIAPVHSKILYAHDKWKLMVPINSFQPHEHHGTIINAQFLLHKKPLKTTKKP